MAYYDALVTKWGTLSGTTAAKLAAINALTVAVPQPAIIAVDKIKNAIVAADLGTLTTNQLLLLQLYLLGAGTVDASPNTTIRTGLQALFAGKTTTLANLTTLVAPYDNATIPWWQATIAQGGGGLSSAISANDLAAAGGLT